MGEQNGHNKRQVVNYFILYHLLLSFKFEKKIYELRQKKRGFLHTVYDDVKTMAQISCAVLAQLIHSIFCGVHCCPGPLSV